MTDKNEDGAPVVQEDPKNEHLTSDHESFFAEQDKKFEEMHRKLQELKVENKKHMDTIINSLDQLIADKNYIENTLEQIHDQKKALEELEGLDIPDDIPIPILEKPLSIKEILAKVAGSDEEEDTRSNDDEADQKDSIESDEKNVKKKLKNVKKCDNEEKMDTVGIGQSCREDEPLLDKEELLKDLNLNAGSLEVLKK